MHAYAGRFSILIILTKILDKQKYYAQKLCYQVGNNENVWKVHICQIYIR